jgi:hypothetical protein
MTTSERKRLLEVRDRLFELYVQQEQAKEAREWGEVGELQAEIDAANAERAKLYS